jgi:hypothetical protein
VPPRLIGLRLDEVLEIVRRLDEQPAGIASLLVDDLIDRLDAMTTGEVERLVEVLLDLHRRDMPRWCRLGLGLQGLVGGGLVLLDRGEQLIERWVPSLWTAAPAARKTPAGADASSKTVGFRWVGPIQRKR